MSFDGYNTRIYKCGVLGATGMVGQRFIQLLETHPWFKVHALGASSRSAGKRYDEAVNWKLSSDIPSESAALIVEDCSSSDQPKGRLAACDFVFSGLDSVIAGTVESAFANYGIPVFSNSKNHRTDPLVPLIVPTVNGDHFDLINAQQLATGRSHGFIVCNANCSTTGLSIALKPLHDAYGLDTAMVTTLQAVSGAGYPGLSVMDMAENIVPFISGEEDKMETEPHKILGTLNDSQNGIHHAMFKVSAMCNRVMVIDGHTECVSVRLLRKPASLAEVSDVLSNYSSLPQSLKLPSAPKCCIKVTESDDRPQPRLDRMRGAGFTVTIGRLRSCPVLDIKFVLLSHNTVIGAAGSAILNAELAAVKKLLNRSYDVGNYYGTYHQLNC